MVQGGLDHFLGGTPGGNGFGADFGGTALLLDQNCLVCCAGLAEPPAPVTTATLPSIMPDIVSS